MKVFISPTRILFLAALLIVLINLFLAKQKVMYGGDEIISYLCANGNQENYSRVLHHQYPYGSIAEAQDYKVFFEPNVKLAYTQIAEDLSKTDLHPPLYFWLLYTFIRVIGMHTYTGVLLNMLIQLLSLWPLYKLGSLLLKNQTIAALSVVCWCASAALINGVLPFARPYMLLSLVHICYALAFFMFVNGSTRFNMLALLIITATGLMVHYSFLNTGLCYLLAACIFYKKTGYRKILFILFSWGFAAFILWLLHPHFANSFALQQARAGSFNMNELFVRAGKTFLAFIQFILPVMQLKLYLLHINKFVLNIYFTTATIVGVVGFVRYKKRLKALFTAIMQQVRHDLFITVNLLIILSVIVPYLLFIYPFHAMGNQYLIVVYPYLALWFVLLLYHIKPVAKYILIALFCLGSGISLLSFYRTQKQFNGLIATLQQHTLIVVNDADRRSFPRLIPFLKDSNQVLIIADDDASKDSLMKEAATRYPDYLFIRSFQTGYTKPLQSVDFTGQTYNLDDGIVWNISVHDQR